MNLRIDFFRNSLRLEKWIVFVQIFLINFESICVHMVEKFIEKDAKKGHFNNRMEFRKKSNS